jgi:hypothetical protein
MKTTEHHSQDSRGYSRDSHWVLPKLVCAITATAFRSVETVIQRSIVVFLSPKLCQNPGVVVNEVFSGCQPYQSEMDFQRLAKLSPSPSSGIM